MERAYFIQYVKIFLGEYALLKANITWLKDPLITLYYSFVYPYFTNGNHVCGIACTTYIKKMLQKRITEIIAGVNNLKLFHNHMILLTLPPYFNKI